MMSLDSTRRRNRGELTFRFDSGLVKLSEVISNWSRSGAELLSLIKRVINVRSARRTDNRTLRQATDSRELIDTDCVEENHVSWK